jgi:hypothetical protein
LPFFLRLISVTVWAFAFLRDSFILNTTGTRDTKCGHQYDLEVLCNSSITGNFYSCHSDDTALGPITQGYRGRSVKLTTHLYLV